MRAGQRTWLRHAAQDLHRRGRILTCSTSETGYLTLRRPGSGSAVSDEARQRAKTTRQRTLVGLHRNGFYDG